MRGKPINRFLLAFNKYIFSKVIRAIFKKVFVKNNLRLIGIGGNEGCLLGTVF